MVGLRVVLSVRRASSATTTAVQSSFSSLFLPVFVGEAAGGVETAADARPTRESFARLAGEGPMVPAAAPRREGPAAIGSNTEVVGTARGVVGSRRHLMGEGRKAVDGCILVKWPQ